MKIDIGDIELALKNNGIDPAVKTKILSDLEQAAEEEKAHKEKKPRRKSIYSLLRPGEDADLLYLVKTDKDFDFGIIQQVLNEVKEEHNSSKKGAKNPVKSNIEALEDVKPKLFKSRGVTKISGEPLVIIEVKGK